MSEQPPAGAMLLHEHSSGRLAVTGVDEYEERIAIARAKAAAASRGAELKFQTAKLDAIDYADDTFSLVVGDASMIEPQRIPDVLNEMVRVAKPDAKVALSLVSSSSYGEFFSIYWEALFTSELEEQALEVESLIKELPTVSEVEQMAAQAGLDDIESWATIEEFPFPTGKDFVESPLISNFLLPRWLDALPADDEDLRQQVIDKIERLIDEERTDLEFALSIKATLVTGRKSRMA
ncbi:MAG: methyltransferase domain-containing protein [Pyrinomonadaceae bacterium]